MRDLRTIILAAGKGTRMKSDLPKVLHTVCGQPIIDYVVDVAKAVGSLKIYVVLGHQMDVIKSHLDKILITVKQKRLLGTADAVRTVEPYLKDYCDDVLILCGDTPLLNKGDIKDLIKNHRKSKAVCTLLTAKVRKSNGYGRIIRGSDGSVIAIREDKDADKREREINEINVGVYCCQSDQLFKALKAVELNAKKKEFYFTDIIELWASQGHVIKAMISENPNNGLGVNNREDLATAEMILRKQILRRLMLNGVTIVDPLTTYIDATVKIGRDTIIRPFTFIEKDVWIGRNCVIGPFARLRPGTRLGNKVEIGNFAEVSRSTIGDGTLVKHFSFLGDARVGAKVNIGAGTVTANYDGKNKNVTQIADQAFIGSDAVLVAPVKIGKKGVVGAGSVVTKGKNVPAGKVAVGIPAKVIARRKF